MGHPWGLWGQDLSHTSTKKFLTSISGYLESIYTPWTSELYGTYKKSKNDSRTQKYFAVCYVLGGGTLNKDIWPCQILTELIFGVHANFSIILQKKVVSLHTRKHQGENEFMYCGYYCMSPSGIILSQNVINDQLKNFTCILYHIRTMPHESINLIGRIANPPGMELCAG